MGSFDTKNPCNLTVEDQEKLLALLRGNFSYNGKTLFRSKLDANTVTALSIVDGAVISSKLTLGTQNWSTDIVFSPTDHDTVAWTSGSILTSDGSLYTISSGNTGNMAAFTYIFFDTAISETTLQVTTDYSLVTSDTAILLCVASFIADTSQNAFYIPAIGTFGINSTVISPNSISTSKIQALAITTGLLSAGAVTAAKINVAQLSAIAVDAGTLTAGTIIGLTIKTSSTNPKVQMDSSNGFRAFDAGGNVIAQLGTSGFNQLQTIAAVDTSAQLQITNGGGSIRISDNPGSFNETQLAILGGASGTGAVAITYLSGGGGHSVVFKDTGATFNNQNINFSSGFGIAQGGQSVALGSNVVIYVSSAAQATFTSTNVQLTNDLLVGGLFKVNTVTAYNARMSLFDSISAIGVGQTQYQNLLSIINTTASNTLTPQTTVGIYSLVNNVQTGNATIGSEGIFGSVYLNAPHSFTGEHVAVVGICYTIAQPANAAINNTGAVIGVYGRVTHYAAGTLDYAVCLEGEGPEITGSGTITNAFGCRIGNSMLNFATGTITNAVGLWIQAITGGSGSNYAIQSDGGQSYHVGNLLVGASGSAGFTVDIQGSLGIGGRAVSTFNNGTHDVLYLV